MKTTTEAVLDHFGTAWTASPGTKSSMGLQLDRAKSAMVDSEGKTISLPGKDHVALEGEMHVHDDCRPDPHITTDRMHTEIMARAAADRVAREFGQIPVLPLQGLEALRPFARRTKMLEGAVAANVIAAYQRWVMTNGLARRDNPKAAPPKKSDKPQPFEMHSDEARERSARDVFLQRRALDAIGDWMRSVDPTTPQGVDTAPMYSDAIVALDHWLKSKGGAKKRGKKNADVWMTLTEVAKRTGMSERTLRHQCDRGELPARKREQDHGKPVWEINLSACLDACDESADETDGVKMVTRRMALGNIAA